MALWILFSTPSLISDPIPRFFKDVEFSNCSHKPPCVMEFPIMTTS